MSLARRYREYIAALAGGSTGTPAPAAGEPSPAARQIQLPQRGKIRARAMFRKLRTARYLRAGVEGDEAWIGWDGAAATIARVHHEGLSDRPAPAGKPVRYARRVLLGLSDEDRVALMDRLMRALTGRP